MNDFNSYNKISHTYWLKKDLNHFKIKVKLKSQDAILTLPKFKDYSKGLNILNLENATQQHIFKWQEKIFSKWEVQRYIDHHNCITEVELNYHDIIKNMDQKTSNIYTYVHEDHYLPLPLDDFKQDNGFLKLEPCLTQLGLYICPSEKIHGGSHTVSKTHLFSSQENVGSEHKDWMAMHIVLDNSDYNEDAQLVYKQDITLVSVYHNITQNYMIISPDVNDLELNPYAVETSSGAQLGYQYAVEIEFDDMESGDELEMLLKKLYKACERKQKHLLNFYIPSLGTRFYYITLEILSAKEFDADSLYIKFDIKVPEELQCKDTLQGRTHTSKSIATEIGPEWNFGHIVEFTIEADSRTDPAPVKLFFEAISSDWWGRHRTEGYRYLPLSLNPGSYTKELSCQRPEELNTVEANSRRFFLGGCHLIKDLDVLVEPQSKDANFSYTTTGSIAVRWNIISQCQVGAISTVSDPTYGVSTASALLRGAETALQKYRRAKARLAAATGHIVDAQGSGIN